MKRFITACIFISIIIICCIVSLVYIKNKKDDFINTLNTAYTQAKNGEYENAEKNVDKFIKDWKANEKLFMLFLHRQDIDEITFTNREFEEFIDAHELPEFYAELKKVMALLDHTWETEVPILINIL